MKDSKISKAKEFERSIGDINEKRFLENTFIDNKRYIHMLQRDFIYT